MDPDDELLSNLDEALIGIRLMLNRPAFGQQLLEGLDFAGGIAGLRVLRVTERLSRNQVVPSIRDIAEELAVEHSTASRAVDSVVKAGLLRKSACDDDLRRANLKLTDEGRAVLAQVTARRQAHLERATANWSDKDALLLTELLNRLQSDFVDETP